MLDIGWTELLVIAVVLIVVVGPKDLPPMLRAFGKMTANLRRMAGDFRTQFDQALREADMDDVRQTIGDVQKYHPANALREAINPLREMGNEIRSDLQKATTLPASETTEAVTDSVHDLIPEPSLSLPETPPIAPPTAPPQPAVAPATVEAGKGSAASAPAPGQPAVAPAAAAKPDTTAAAVVAANDTAKPATRTPRKSAAKVVSDGGAATSETAKKTTQRSKAVVVAPEPSLPVEAQRKPARSRTKVSKAVLSVEAKVDQTAEKPSKPRTRKKPATTGKDDA